MLTSWRVNGLWWLPSDPTDFSNGTLVYDPEEGFELMDVTGSLAPVHPKVGPGPELLLGYDHDGTAYTCLDSFHIGYSSNQAGIKVAKLDIDTVFRGRLIKSREQISFRSFRCLYSNLFTWLFEFPAFGSGETKDEALEIRLL